MIFGTGVAILTSVYPPGERGHALGLNTAAVYTGLSLGPVLGGFLVHAFGWRSVFWAIRARRRVRPRPRARPARGRVGRRPRRALRLRRIDRLRRRSRLPDVRVLAAALAPRPRAHGRRRPGPGRVRPLRAAFAVPAPRPPPLPPQPHLRLLQPGRPVQLQRHVGRGLPDEPLPPVHQGPAAPDGGPRPHRPTRRHGRRFAVRRTALGPDRAADHRFDRHGPLGRGPRPLLLPRPRHRLRLHRRRASSASASASGSSRRPTRTRSCARSKSATSASPRPPSGPCV